MNKTKQEQNGRKVNFVLSQENQVLLLNYLKTLPTGTGIKVSEFYNQAVKNYLKILLKGEK